MRDSSEKRQLSHRQFTEVGDFQYQKPVKLVVKASSLTRDPVKTASDQKVPVKLNVKKRLTS